VGNDALNQRGVASVKIGLSLHRLHRFGFDASVYAAIARKAEELI